MTGLGTIVNTAAIIVGGLMGLALKKRLPKRITETVMQGVGLAVAFIGISGALGAAFRVEGDKVASEHILLMIISLALGGFVGECIHIEGRLDTLAKFCEKKFSSPGGESTFTQGFVTATLVFCVGSMAIVGSLEDGILGNRDILYAKSTLDGISAMVFASTLGFGVLFSAVAVGFYQGAITVSAIAAQPFLNDVLVAQMSIIGSVLIMSIGLNMLKISKIKTGNLLPAIFIPVFYHTALMLFRFIFVN